MGLMLADDELQLINKAVAAAPPPMPAVPAQPPLPNPYQPQAQPGMFAMGGQIPAFATGGQIDPFGNTSADNGASWSDGLGHMWTDTGPNAGKWTDASANVWTPTAANQDAWTDPSGNQWDPTPDQPDQWMTPSGAQTWNPSQPNQWSDPWNGDTTTNEGATWLDQSGAQAYPVLPPAAAPTRSPLTSGAHASSGDLSTFGTSLAGILGKDPAKVTAILAELSPWEGGSADNPLNTTQPMAGTTTINPDGVKRYASFDDGVAATAKTLQNGYYPKLLETMDTGAITPDAFPNIMTWGTGNYIVNWYESRGLPLPGYVSDWAKSHNYPIKGYANGGTIPAFADGGDIWNPDSGLPDDSWAMPPADDPYMQQLQALIQAQALPYQQPDTSAGDIWTPDQSLPDDSWAQPPATWTPDSSTPDDSWANNPYLPPVPPSAQSDQPQLLHFGYGPDGQFQSSEQVPPPVPDDGNWLTDALGSVNDALHYQTPFGSVLGDNPGLHSTGFDQAQRDFGAAGSLNQTLKDVSGGNLNIEGLPTPLYNVIDPLASPAGIIGMGAGALQGGLGRAATAAIGGVGAQQGAQRYGQSDLPGADIVGSPLGQTAAGLLGGIGGYHAPELIGPEGALTSGRFNLTPGLNTREIGPGDPLYHGSPNPIEGDLRPSPAGDPLNYDLGPGLYTSERPDTGSLYAKPHPGGVLTLGDAGYQPGANVSELTPTTRGEYIESLDPLSVTEQQRIQSAFQANTGATLPLGDDGRAVAAFDAIRAAAPPNVEPNQFLQRILQDAGFKGVAQWGELTVFDPSQLEPLTAFRARQQNLTLGLSTEDVSGGKPAPPEGILPELAPKAEPAPEGVTPGPDLTLSSAHGKLLDALTEESNFRKVGTPQREIAEGRSRQAGGIASAINSGLGAGASGEDIAQAARSGARVGPLRQSFADAVALTPEERGAVMTDLAQRQQAGEISPFQYLRNSLSINQLLDGKGLQPAQIRDLRPIFGDEIMDKVSERAKPVQSDAALQKQTAAYNARAQAAQQRQAQAEIARTNKLNANPGPKAAAFNEETGQVGQETVDRQAFRDKWAAISKLNKISQQTIDDLNNPLRTTPEERAIGQKALTDRANRIQNDAGRFAESAQGQAAKDTEAGLRSHIDDLLNDWAGSKPGLAGTEARTAAQSTMDAWLHANRTLPDGIPPEASNMLVAIVQRVQQAIVGDVPDSFLSNLLHRQGYLETMLKNSGMDPETARTVSNQLGAAELARRFPTGIPQDIKDMLASTKTDYTSKGQTILRGASAFNNMIKRSTFGLTEGLTLMQTALKTGLTENVPITAGIVNRLLNLAHSGLDTTGELSRSIAYGNDGVLQGLTGTYGGEVASEGHVPSLWELSARGAGKVGVPGMTPVENTLAGWSQAMSDLHFNKILGTLRNLTHEGNLVIAHLAGQDINDPAVRSGIANFANYATGSAESALVRNRALVESSTLLTPSMTRAQIGQIAKVAGAMINGSPAERAAASAAIVSAGIAAIAINKLLNDNFGMTPMEWDPSKPGFGNITLPFGSGGKGTVVSLIPQVSVLKYFGQAMRNLAEGDPAGAGDALVKLGLGRAASIPQIGAAAVGYGFGPNGIAMGTLGQGESTFNRILNLTPLPSLLDGFVKGDSDRYTLGFNALGAQAYPESDFAARDRGVADQFKGQTDSSGKPIEQYKQLNAEQKKTYDAANGGKLPVTGDTPTGQAILDSQKQRAAIDATYRTNIDAAAAAFTKDGDGTKFRDSLTEQANNRRVALAQQQADSSSPIPAPNNPQDKATNDWFATYEQARGLDGKIDQNALAQLQAKLTGGWDPQTQEYVQRQIAGGTKDASNPVVQKYFDDLKALQPYWDATNKERYLESQKAADGSNPTLDLLAKYGYATVTRQAYGVYQKYGAQQQADDAALTADQGYAKTWRDNLHTRQKEQSAALDALYSTPAGSPLDALPPRDPLVGQYTAYLKSTEDPKTGQPDWNASDRYLADHPDVQKAIDAQDKRPVDPTVQAYRDDTKRIADSGYWDAKDKMAQGYVKYYGLDPSLDTYQKLWQHAHDGIYPQALAANNGDTVVAEAETKKAVDRNLADLSNQASDYLSQWRLGSPTLTRLLSRWGYIDLSNAALETLLPKR